MSKMNWIVECLISMVTCGLYGIFYWYKVDKNMRAINPYPTKQVLNYWLALLIGLVTGGIVMWVYYYQVFTALEEEATKLVEALNLKPMSDLGEKGFGLGVCSYVPAPAPFTV